MSDTRAGTIETDLEHDVFENEPILAALDGLGICTDEAGSVTLEGAILDQRHSCVQSSLATECRQDGIRLFALEDFFNDLWSDRLDVGPLRELWIGHDRRGIRIHEHNIVALLGKRFAGLNARVVEFAALADHNRTGTNEEDFFDRRVFRHGAGDYANPVPQGNEMVRLKIRRASEQKYGTTQIQHRHQRPLEKTQ